MTTQKEYWNRRYERGKLWGSQPCPSANMSIPYLERNDSNTILVPGCGYGRNSAYFAKKGYDVTGVDISDEAIKHAVNDIEPGKNNSNYQVNDLFSLGSIGKQYDAIFLSNVIHLFLEKDRSNLMQIMDSFVASNGLFILTAISESDDKNFGVGKKLRKTHFCITKKCSIYMQRKWSGQFCRLVIKYWSRNCILKRKRILKDKWKI